MRATNILQLPFEILAGHILAILDPSDLSRVARVCRHFYQLSQSNYLWQKKFFHDYPSYRPGKTLRQSHGWKRIYQAMDRVEVYTWGSNADCRLGYGRTPKKFYESLPKRIRRLDGTGIVQLAPTGWGCHALDKQGNIWAWGRIMESNGMSSDAMPRMLKRPRNVVDIAAGRQVVLAKDQWGQVWQWCRENKAVEVTFAGSQTGLRSSTTTEQHTEEEQQDDDPIDQISAGWDICAALSRSGKIFAWRPPQSADGRFQHRIHVEHWVSLHEQGTLGFEATIMDSDRFIKIAAGTDYVVTVSSMGKVYIFRRLDSPHYHEPAEARRYQGRSRYPHRRLQQVLDPHTPVDRIVIETIVEGSMQERVVEIRGQILGHGLYLPIFSEALTRTVTRSYDENEQLERIKRHHRRRSPCSFGDHINYTHPEDKCLNDFIDNSNNDINYKPTISCPTTVSANFQSFSLHHHSGKALLGREDVQSKSCPIVMERLLSNACQVEFGDHHQGLLTEDGQLRTWGSFADGALGHGDLRADCAIPTVVEGALKNKYVIKLAMAGWQSACLAIDLNDDKVQTSHHYLLDSHQHHHHRHRSFAGSFGKRKDDEGEDQSPGHDSGHGGSGNSVSSDGVDSSDGEDWNGENMSEMPPPLSGPSYIGIPSTSLYSFSMVPHYALSRPGPSLPAPTSTSIPSTQMYSSCTASCSLLVSPHSHHGSSVGHVRTPLRKRSLSMVERHGEMRQEYAEKYQRPPVLALTRLNPTLSVYDPDRGLGQQGQGQDAVRHLADQIGALGH
ncbi:hypothetical protein BG005_005380 [Podila minutissima]|nr:hypothetical protein BG005_005380 [Podila minutissima]